MNLRTIIIIVVLLVLLGIVFLIDQARQDDTSDVSNIITSVIAHNQTQGSDAVTVDARSQDFIAYTLTAENPTKKVIEGYVIEVDITDITELAILVDAQGANFNSDKKTLTWTPLDIPAEGKVDKQFTVRVKDDLPEGSDLVMITSFNNEVKVTVAEDKIAGTGISTNASSTVAGTQVDAKPYVAPNTGVAGTASMLFAGFATLGYALARFRK
ncbi:MAG: hypothetical protein Q8P83_03205 [bacterium]|nr:hypothetical protein [bacterium]